jgi:hypothetical protein
MTSLPLIGNIHSALLIIDIQHDFTLIGGTSEIPIIVQAVQYIQQRLVHVYKEIRLSYNSYYQYQWSST